MGPWREMTIREESRQAGPPERFFVNHYYTTFLKLCVLYTEYVMLVIFITASDAYPATVRPRFTPSFCELNEISLCE